MLRQVFQAAKTEFAKHRGILCFSRGWTNSLLWSHYADRHAGLCLGFEVPASRLEPIKYARKRMIVDPVALSRTSETDIVETFRPFMFTKYAHWKYESEMRCLVELNEKDIETGLYFASFSNELRLAEVIVGPRSSVTRNDLAAALADLLPFVRVFKARPAFRTFKVTRQKNDLLWK